MYFTSGKPIRIRDWTPPKGNNTPYAYKLPSEQGAWSQTLRPCGAGLLPDHVTVRLQTCKWGSREAGPAVSLVCTILAGTGEQRPPHSLARRLGPCSPQLPGPLVQLRRHPAKQLVLRIRFVRARALGPKLQKGLFWSEDVLN